MLPCTMSKARKIPLSSLNEYLTCKLCRGYYIDATTIIECLHSFCRSCIVRYLEKNKYCPICDVQVHKTKPLINIRKDKILQSCVYKLVPRLFQNEMLRRKSFYGSHSEENKNLDLEELGEVNYQHILASDENICVALNYKGSPLTPRYLQCSAAVSIFHLQKLIRSKYDLSFNHRIDIFHEDDILKPYLTLIDVAYSSLWRRKGPLELTYRIYESTLSTANLSLSSPSDDNQISNNNNNNATNDWKEVQIQISENGEMSVTGIQDCLELLDKMDEKSAKSNRQDVVNTADDKLKNIPSKITKVELNQPPISEKNSIDVVLTVRDPPSLPAVTLTASEIRELSKVEEAAKTQLVDSIVLPPPAKKLKKELPELKLIGNKSQKKNGAKSIASPSKADSESVAQSSNSSTTVITSKPVSGVNVTSVTVIPPAYSTQPVTLTTTNTAIAVTAPSTITKVTSATASSKTIGGTTQSSTMNIVVKASSLAVTASNTCVTTSVTSAKLSNSNVVTQTSKTVVQAGSTKRKHPSSLDSAATSTPSSEQEVSGSQQKLPKPTILNHSLSLQTSLNLSRNHPLTTKHQRAIETASTKAGNNIFLTTSQSAAANQLLRTPPVKTYGAMINVPKVPSNCQATTANKQPQISNPYSPVNSHNQNPTVSIAQSSSPVTASLATVASTAPSAILDGSRQVAGQQIGGVDNSNLMIKSKASTPIGYKTLKDPPKTWNPTLHPMHHKVGGPQGLMTGGKAGDLKNVRPAKFFKMRNNMPRYLGCPNSGVKPMFHVHISPDKDKDTLSNTLDSPTPAITSQTHQLTTTTTSVANSQPTTTTTTTVSSSPSSSSSTTSVPNNPNLTIVKPTHPPEQQNIRKHSIVKIDPKTLKPISEKAPECSNLSTVKSSCSVVGGGGTGHNKSAGLTVVAGDQQQRGKQQGKSARGGQAQGQSGRDERQPGRSPHSSDQPSTTSTTNITTTTLNSHLNLRINTTSVSITNPLKKSPHSPKKPTSPPNNHQSPPTIKSSSSNSNKPQPLNLQQSLPYTPSNPFIPNPLASPTLNPNQFNLLTAAAVAAAAASGFHHGYDPRYHHHHHHLPYHHQLYQPRLSPFAPPGPPNWWSGGGGGQHQQHQQQQVPLSSPTNRNTSPRGLIWNGPPSAESQVCSPKEATSAASLDAKTASLDPVSLPTRSSCSSSKKIVVVSDGGDKDINVEDKSSGKAQTTSLLSGTEQKSKTVSDRNLVEGKGTTATAEKVVVQKSTSGGGDAPKESVVLAV